MKNFLSFFSPKNLGDIIQTLWARFPIAGMIVLVNTGFIWYEVNTTNESDLIMRVILALVVTFFLSTGVSIFAESQKQTPVIKWAQIIAILYGIGFFFALYTLDMNSGVFNEPFIYFSLHLVGFISWLFFAPYLLRHIDNENASIQYTNYFTRIAWICLMSAIVGGALAALGSIAISAVGVLFDINPLISEWKLYENWIIIALSLAAPLYGLLHLPLLSDIGEKEYDVNKFFAFIIRFIVIPFVLLYFCILYAYSIKVLANISDWPKGEVSWLVIGFSIFGYLGYIFSKSYESEHTIIQIFRRYFPLVVIPQIPMLGYAIALRITQYDLTMNRYFVVIFGVWLTIISLYFILSKTKALTIIPGTLTLITLLISIGPWGVYQLPLERQYTLLIKNLELSGILKDGVISKAPDSLDPVLENSIYSGIQYVCDFESCTRIKTMFASVLVEAQKRDEKDWKDNTYNAGKKYNGMNSYTTVGSVTEVLGIEMEDLSLIESERKYLNYTAKGDDLYNSPLAISGYDKLYALQYYYPGGNADLSRANRVIINVDQEQLILREQDRETIFSLREINAKLLQKYQNINNSTLRPEDLTFILTQNNRSIKILLQSYALRNPKFTETGTDEYVHISGWALVKE